MGRRPKEAIEKAAALIDDAVRATIALADAKERLGYVRAKAIAIGEAEQNARAEVRELEREFTAAFAALREGGGHGEQP